MEQLLRCDDPVGSLLWSFSTTTLGPFATTVIPTRTGAKTLGANLIDRSGFIQLRADPSPTDSYLVSLHTAVCLRTFDVSEEAGMRTARAQRRLHFSTSAGQLKA